jgi:hypothetical protein
MPRLLPPQPMDQAYALSCSAPRQVTPTFLVVLLLCGALMPFWRQEFGRTCSFGYALLVIDLSLSLYPIALRKNAASPTGSVRFPEQSFGRQLMRWRKA